MDADELLARIDERVSILIENHNKLEEWMKEQDTRICELEACKNQGIGTAVGVSIVVSALTALGGLIVAFYTGFIK